ncbi:MAG: hypothetical protein IPJ78_02440 [Gemmatimonadetes bacterium]|nr:hypothetical protein [Gemmatimonadota bacterium]
MEQESIALDVIVDAVGAVVNRESMLFYGEGVDVEIQFQSHLTARLGSALIADLLEPMSAELVGGKLSVPEVLSRIAQEPQFDQNGSVEVAPVLRTARSVDRRAP